MIEHAYIHIPFCIRKCKYCSFVSGKDIKNKEQYINALIYEIRNKYNQEKLKTIYIGGGTPSLLETDDINKILSEFKYEKTAEITLEANPETVSLNKFIEYKNMGINRISLGVQTFNDHLLKLIGRKHTNKDIYSAIDTIKSSGFDNYSIDLIYGLPEQSLSMFEEDLKQAVNISPKHISTYGLKIEEGSFFYDNMPNNIPDNDVQAEMYLLLSKILKENGFNHYEISNFAREGYESKHNCAYWLNKEYYGFGLNASGYERNMRYKNISALNEYLKNPLIHEEEIILTEQETYENEIFLALRLNKGLDIQAFNKKYKLDFIKKYKNIIDKYEKLKLINSDTNHISLTEQGFLLSNEIMSEFLN